MCGAWSTLTDKFLSSDLLSGKGFPWGDNNIRLPCSGHFANRSRWRHYTWKQVTRWGGNLTGDRNTGDRNTGYRGQPNGGMAGMTSQQPDKPAEEDPIGWQIRSTTAGTLIRLHETSWSPGRKETWSQPKSMDQVPMFWQRFLNLEYLYSSLV